MLTARVFAWIKKRREAAARAAAAEKAESERYWDAVTYVHRLPYEEARSLFQSLAGDERMFRTVPAEAAMRAAFAARWTDPPPSARDVFSQYSVVEIVPDGATIDVAQVREFSGVADERAFAGSYLICLDGSDDYVVMRTSVEGVYVIDSSLRPSTLLGPPDYPSLYHWILVDTVFNGNLLSVL